MIKSALHGRCEGRFKTKSLVCSKNEGKEEIKDGGYTNDEVALAAARVL
jgi:hypothetical protein